MEIIDIIRRKKYERVYYSYYSRYPANSGMQCGDEHKLEAIEQH
jgi:hypothetical protein